MAIIGYHASHEQFTPSRLLKCAQLAEQAGFQAAMCSDHFHPWSDAQGQSGFAWSWLGAALQATSLSFGMVCAPGQRYSPAIIAQAAATLSEMFPSRLWCAFGSGQYLNEHITGERWPSKPERNARLLEAIKVIRALWAGQTVTHRGSFVVEEAKLYTRPTTPPLIFGAAITPETAEWVAPWADGLITVVQETSKVRAVAEAFRRSGGEGKPMSLQVHIAYAPTDEEAMENAFSQWRTNIFDSKMLSDLKMPAQFDSAARYVRPEDVRGAVRVSSDIGWHIDTLREFIEMGYNRLYLHEVGPDQERFVEVFGERVLPELKKLGE
jgi:probable non-F420 flavinoid oxidoreductase